jgi:histidinol phosphatase-like enzyme
VEKGYITQEAVEEVAAHTMDLLELYFPFYYAPYKYHAPQYLLNLRKPNIGMAKEAINDWGEMDVENSFMVGDYISDEKFADNLGIRYVDIKDFLLE